MVKKEHTHPSPAPTVSTPASTSIPVIAVALGAGSLMTSLWFFGIVAVILGIIGLRRYKENRGLSIAGIVTGVISTILLVISVVTIIIAVTTSILHGDMSSFYDDSETTPFSEQDNDSYDRREYRGYQDGI
jgi:hypothetical protein